MSICHFKCSNSLKLKLFQRAVSVFIITHFICAASQEVSHPGTDQAQTCLASVGIRSWAAGWYGCFGRHTRTVVVCYLLFTYIYDLLTLGALIHAWARTYIAHTFLYALFVCAMDYDSKNQYYYLDITLLNVFNSSAFRFTMGLVLILLMNR